MKKNLVRMFLVSCLLFLILFIPHYWKSLGEYSFNLVIIVIASLICWIARELWGKGKISDELLLAFVGIIIAVSIFVLQNLQSIEDMRYTLQSANKYNCNTVKELQKEITETKDLNNVSPRIKRRYSTEIYKNNIGYLLKQFDSKKTSIVMETIGDMDESNRFLEMSQANFYEFPTHFLSAEGRNNFLAYIAIGKIYDKQILELAKNILFGIRKMDDVFKSGVSDKCMDP